MACAIDLPPAGHDQLRFSLMREGQRMWAAREQPQAFHEARDRLVAFCRLELLSHLERDEGWLLQVQRCPEGRLLAEAVRAENRAMTGAVYELASTVGASEALALTRVLHAFLAAHDHHEKLLRTAAA